MGFNNENARRLVLDIETVATPEAASLLDPVRAPANYKDPAKIEAYCTEKLAERTASAALEADLCEVIAVGVRLEADDTAVRTIGESSEEDLLGFVWEHVKNRAVVGFNVLG